MSNPYYENTPLPPREVARAERVNDELQAVEDGFAKLPAPAAIASGSVTWATSTGGPDNYALTIPVTPSAYADGMTVAFVAAGSNTAAVSVNVNGLGAKQVLANVNGAALGAGAILAGSVVVIVYSGSSFRLTSVNAASALGEWTDPPKRSGSAIYEGDDFVAGGTFTRDPANRRHDTLKVHDDATPMTAAMTVDLNITSPDNRTADRIVVVTKGDSSSFNVTVSGFDLGGLGTWTLRNQYDSVLCVLQTPDVGAPGVGPDGLKFERAMRLRQPNDADPNAGDLIPKGGISVAGRDSTQAAVLYGLPPNNSIRLVEDGADRYIQAVAKLDPTLRPLRIITASRVLNGPDQAFRTVTPIGNDPTYAELPMVYFQGTVLSDPIIADIPHDAAPGFAVQHFVDDAQSGKCSYRALGTGTVNGEAASNLLTLVVGAPGGAVVVSNPDGNSPEVHAWPIEEAFLEKEVAAVTGALTFRSHHDRTLIATGNVTLPATVGFYCVIRASGANRTVTRGADVWTVVNGSEVVARVLAGGVGRIHPVTTQVVD